jgi:lysophospholipase L1-like esterase
MARTAPDVIILCRGTNDFSHSPYVRLTDGYFDSTAWTYPTTDVSEGIYGLKEAISLTISKLREAYPLAMIVLCTLNVFKRNNYANFPTRNGYNTLPQYNDAIRECADFFGCGLIDFARDGITFENGGIGGFYGDYDSSDDSFTHPNDKGHAMMGAKAISDLLNIKYKLS